MTQTIEHQELKALENEVFDVVMGRWVELKLSADVWSESTEGVCTKSSSSDR